MAVRIRLRRMGRKKKPQYRVVVTDKASARDGRFVESLGHYKPLTEPARLVIDLERVDYWVEQGAVPSDTVNSLIRKARTGGTDKLAVGEVDPETEKARQAEALAARRKAEAAAEARKQADAAAEAAEAPGETAPQDVAAESPADTSPDQAAPDEAAEDIAEEAEEVEAKAEPDAGATDVAEAAEKEEPVSEAEDETAAKAEAPEEETEEKKD